METDWLTETFFTFRWRLNERYPPATSHRLILNRSFQVHCLSFSPRSFLVCFLMDSVWKITSENWIRVQLTSCYDWKHQYVCCCLRLPLAFWYEALGIMEFYKRQQTCFPIFNVSSLMSMVFSSWASLRRCSSICLCTFLVIGFLFSAFLFVFE